MKWPESVPVLSAKDMYQGGFRDACHHDLVGWAFETFGSPYPPELQASATAVAEACNRVTGLLLLWPNDNLTHAERAHLWNRMMYLLGYTENNPQGAIPHKLEKTDDRSL